MQHILNTRSAAYSRSLQILDAVGPMLPESGASQEGREWCLGMGIALTGLVNAARNEAGANDLTVSEALAQLGGIIELMDMAFELDAAAGGETIEGEAEELV